MLRPVAVLIALVALGAGILSSAPAAAPTANETRIETPIGSRVLINEMANGDADADSHTFVELRNWGDERTDLTGWHLFRCSPEGLRSNVGRPDGDLTGVILDPGAVVTISRAGMPGQVHVTEPLGLTGFGLYLEAPDGVLVDRVGVYPNAPWPTQSECTPDSGNLPNVLDFARNESWQRVDDTGDVARDFVVAPSTLGSTNADRGPEPIVTTVVVSELTGAGPGGSDDEFVELHNDGDEPVEIGGWTFDRCTASGRVRPDTRELRIEDGTVLAPGARWIMGGPDYSGRVDARYPTGLGDIEFGVMLRTAAGLLVDRVAVSAYGDSACQGEDAKLAAILDAVAGESWQRADGEHWIVAHRTPDAGNRTAESSVFRSVLHYPAEPSVAISEIATDPTTEGMPGGSVQRNWIELGNYGASSVDIGGWTIRRCQRDGTRAIAPQVTIPDGTVLAPGDAYLAARAGTEAAGDADSTYSTALHFLGTGVWLADERGRRVDSVGIYAVNVLDATNVTASPCTKGVALTTYQPDRLLEQTFQRSRFTGVDADDFVVGPATPGVLDLVPWTDPVVRVTGIEGPESAAPSPASVSREPVVAEPVVAVPVVIREAWGGVSETLLVTLRGSSERALDPADPGAITDGGYGYPYQRLVIDAGALSVGSAISWSGTTEPRHEVQLSAWNAGAWRPVGVASSSTGDVRIDGVLSAGDIEHGTLTLLVQDGPRTIATTHGEPDGLLENPADYDFAISHVTDTQYLTESYPEVYAQLVSWIADNAEPLKIEFATHTGDIVQNWVEPDQNEARARREFEVASAAQAILEDAGVRTSVLPGNHDNKRGVSAVLFNEFFGPDRYGDESWYGGSIAPGDNSANFSIFESAGGRFLMLSLPYAYGDRELTWAEGIIAGHPEYNVVISTHEHVTPKTAELAAGHSTNSRWVSHAQDLWDRLIVPHRNVVLVLSGHFHGLGQITTENAGGMSGHTVVELLADYQEFRTHTGERATGFQRLLQLDLASGTVAVDTFSVRLGAAASHPYDYRQFLPDNGSPFTPANGRPWRIVEAGVQDRYGVDDDEFTVNVAFQYDKSVGTESLSAAGAPR